ncbi:hypothetical protein BH18ACT12_BH18ACT12_10260 [soil metagenome]
MKCERNHLVGRAGRAVNGLGTTLFGNRQIRPDLTRAIRHTRSSLLTAIVLALVFGIAIGIYSALRQYSLFDYAWTTLSFVGFALPVFWLALMLQVLIQIYLKWIAIDDYVLVVPHTSPLALRSEPVRLGDLTELKLIGFNHSGSMQRVITHLRSQGGRVQRFTRSMSYVRCPLFQRPTYLVYKTSVKACSTTRLARPELQRRELVEGLSDPSVPSERTSPAPRRAGLVQFGWG